MDLCSNSRQIRGKAMIKSLPVGARVQKWKHDGTRMKPLSVGLIQELETSERIIRTLTKAGTFHPTAFGRVDQVVDWYPEDVYPNTL
jgi:hypothetical protein